MVLCGESLLISCSDPLPDILVPDFVSSDHGLFHSFHRSILKFDMLFSWNNRHSIPRRLTKVNVLYSEGRTLKKGYPRENQVIFGVRRPSVCWPYIHCYLMELLSVRAVC